MTNKGIQFIPPGHKIRCFFPAKKERKEKKIRCFASPTNSSSVNSVVMGMNDDDCETTPLHTFEQSQEI